MSCGRDTGLWRNCVVKRITPFLLDETGLRMLSILISVDRHSAQFWRNKRSPTSNS